MSQDLKRYYGKYEGTVFDNEDPKMLGRIKARVPDVLKDKETGWALPCTPYAGAGVGFYFIPPKNAKVWIEFEAGKLNRPIWSGCYWLESDIKEMFGAIKPTPTPFTAPEMKVIKTKTAMITLNDLDGGGITIETTTGLKIVMDTSGITIRAYPKNVSINDNALVVT
jgi:uncharacterized protein involved in type VI secretion and phage assembly